MAQHQALKMQHQDVKAQQEEDKRAVQTLQSENQKLKVQHQEVKAQQDEDKRTVQMLQNANQELMALLAQTNQRFAAMENENHTLRTELETLSNKPADPMIGVLNHAVDGLNAQLASLQTNLNQTHRSTASAHAELQTLTPQLHSLHGALANLKEDVNTLQVSLDDTPEKAAVAELGDQVAGLVQDKHRADADLRMLKKSVSKLKPETDIDTSSDGPLAAALMPRDEPGQGQLAQGQNIQIQIAELNARTNDHAQRLDVLQDDAGIAQMQPAASGPSEDNNLRRLLGNLWNGEGRR
ncbi:MAG: chromosome segregation ATPase [Burkholderiaceae bacterium]|jgi:chromosome segregation ATPase